eukprot:gene29776-5237_t
MFSLFYGLFEYLLRREEYHVLILGLDKAGKTNVLERLKTQFTQFIGLDPGKILPTVGLNVGRIEVMLSNDLQGAPILVLGNKQDLPQAAGPQEIAEKLGVSDSNRLVKVLPACAYTGQGLKEGLEQLVELIKMSPRTSRLRLKTAH